MARPSFKKIITIIIPEALEERVVFCIGAAGTLHCMMLKWIPIPSVFASVSDNLYRHLMITYGVGWAILLASTFMIDHFDLFGICHTFTSKDEDIVYKLVRQPIMAGFLMAFWLHPVFTTGRLVLATVFTAYIYFIVFMFEEPALIDMFGDEAPRVAVDTKSRPKKMN